VPASLYRTFALGVTAVLALLCLAPVPASAAPAPCDGVWVVVQPDPKDASSAHATCAASYDTGLAALKSAGHTTEFAKGMLSRVDGLPEDADFTSNGGYYWSYWSAPVNAEGRLGPWTYYQVGPDSSKPAVGTAEGWLLTNEQQPTGPALTTLPEAAASATPAATASNPAPVPSSGSPTGLIVAGVVVVVALLGLGGWWLLRGRRR